MTAGWMCRGWKIEMWQCGLRTHGEPGRLLSVQRSGETVVELITECGELIWAKRVKPGAEQPNHTSVGLKSSTEDVSGAVWTLNERETAGRCGQDNKHFYFCNSRKVHF